MYAYELELGGSRVSLWTGSGPNGILNEWGGPSHNHADYEIHVLLSGAVRVDVEGRTYPLQPNQVMVIAPGRYHCRLPETAPLTRLCVNFSVTDGPLRCCLQERVTDCRIFEADGLLLQACSGIDRELQAQLPFGRTILQGFLMQILVEVFRGLEIDCGGEAAVKASGRDPFTHEIDLYFENHVRQGGKVEELANRLFLSPSQLNRLLRENYGMTFREKMLRARMGQAARLLRHTDLPICRIAEEVGYSVSTSFFHVFRTVYGMTPEQYRSQNRDLQHHP